MGMPGAHREQLLASLHLQLERTAKGAIYPVYRRDIDDDAAVDLPEQVRIELFAHLTERRGEQECALRGDDRRVLLVGAQIRDLRCGQDTQLPAVGNGEPFEIFRLGWRKFLEQRCNAVQVRRRFGEARAKSVDRDAHALRRNWL